jgi:hypothetical protein
MIEKYLADYLAGAALLRAAVKGMTHEQALAKPVPGKWSTHEVVCHLADSDMLYAERIKRVLCETNPTFLNADPDTWMRLNVPARQLSDEVDLIEAVRKQVGHILATATDADLKRTGTHTEAGVLSLETLLTRVIGHIPHHVKFIEEKRKLLG